MNTIFIGTTDFDGLIDVFQGYSLVGALIVFMLIGPFYFRLLALAFYPRKYKYRIRAFFCFLIATSCVAVFITYIYTAYSQGPRRAEDRISIWDYEFYLMILGITVFLFSLGVGIFLPNPEKKKKPKKNTKK